jgi:hypothetical protein
MDLSDLFQPVASGPRLPKARDRREEIAGAVVAFGFPLIALVLLTVTELSKQPNIAMLWMPVGFSALGVVICAAVGMRLWRMFVVVLACLWWCLLAGFALVVIDILIFPF